MFLLVSAYPGSPGQRLCMCMSVFRYSCFIENIFVILFAEAFSSKATSVRVSVDKNYAIYFIIILRPHIYLIPLKYNMSSYVPSVL